MQIKQITDLIERFAPLAWQESYDNAGLIVGRPDQEVHAALLAVDVTEEVLDEAERTGCDLVITHHPIVFHALKRFNSADAVQRCVERAIRRGIALYACHTNLDSAPGGMSWRLAELLGVGGLTVLQPALLQPAGEEAQVGFGVVGDLAQPVGTVEFMRRMQRKLDVRVVRYSDPATPEVRRVAVCTGAGASLIGEARRAGADLYVTADLKYNDFMTPDKALTVADIGHFESEYCAIQLLFDILSKNLITFAVRKSEDSRNPVNYLV
ncbi:Nif3-like dinuclear metal center hexameric protein [Alistipes sp.]|uniref:Nif3-like dinuclear metal center hexameric protein n=1 Tax=Alistipes sp. TaxID=1872444 RepID=UPI003AF081B2